MSALSISAIGSLLAQLGTGLYEAQGLFVPLQPQDKIVQEILSLELIVQSIEFIFYVYLVYQIVYGAVGSSITSHRYLDWFLTTPTMLISFVAFFKYLKTPTRTIGLLDSLREEVPTLVQLVVANSLMLLFGFLGERSILPRALGVALGFIPFAYTFKLLYAKYAQFTTLSQILFYFSFFIWGLYGVAAVLPFATKNTFYNILDLFAKNAYGLFLYFYVQRLGTKTQ